MNKDIKDRWVAALESNEFKQGKEALRIGDEFCCLGVLSELAVRDGVIDPAEVLPEDDWRAQRGNGGEVYCYDGEIGNLSDGVAKWAGLTVDDVWGENDGQPVTDCDPYVGDELLSRLNDTGKTFPELAALIKEHL